MRKKANEQTYCNGQVLKQTTQDYALLKLRQIFHGNVCIYMVSRLRALFSRKF
jgi:hypothetical protein